MFEVPDITMVRGIVLLPLRRPCVTIVDPRPGTLPSGYAEYVTPLAGREDCMLYLWKEATLTLWFRKTSCRMRAFMLITKFELLCPFIV